MMTKVSATVEEACKATGLGKTKIYDLIAEGKLRKVKVGRRTLIPMDSLHALVAA